MTDPIRASRRMPSIDLLRGIIMVLMALDHTRDFFDTTPFEPTDLDKTNAPLFFTRWITHYCAPVFVFLAGTAAWLSRAKKSDAELTRFLLSRGAWLIFLELTFVNLAWEFDLTYGFVMLQVIWAIGWSMIFLAALVRLPLRAIALVGAGIILFHNALDRVHPFAGSSLHALWAFVHESDFGLTLGKLHYAILYPVVPWIGVMALGYACGALFVGEDRAPRPMESRSRVLLRAGVAVTLFFVLLRASNVYGDPSKWAPRPDFAGTIESFLNCTKYPPSLCYLAMTLGPSLALLALFDRAAWLETNVVTRVLIVFGRVPLFYYVLHLVLLHAASNVVYYEVTGKLSWRSDWFGAEALVVGLPWTYLAWILAVAALYPACRWFAGVKASEWGRSRAWLSYL